MIYVGIFVLFALLGYSTMAMLDGLKGKHHHRWGEWTFLNVIPVYEYDGDKHPYKHVALYICKCTECKEPQYKRITV